MRLLDLLADGGPRTGGDAHYECRDCGTNVDEGTAACPTCGGEVAVYAL
jgi:rubrerythrin